VFHCPPFTLLLYFSLIFLESIIRSVPEAFGVTCYWSWRFLFVEHDDWTNAVGITCRSNEKSLCFALPKASVL